MFRIFDTQHLLLVMDIESPTTHLLATNIIDTYEFPQYRFGKLCMPPSCFMIKQIRLALQTDIHGRHGITFLLQRTLDKFKRAARNRWRSRHVGRMRSVHEELMIAAWHPRRVFAALEAGVNPEDM